MVPSGAAGSNGIGDIYYMAIPSYKPGTTIPIGSVDVEVTRTEEGQTEDIRFESRSRKAQFNFIGMPGGAPFD